MDQDTIEEIAGIFQTRIGQLVSQYETDIAMLKAQNKKQLKQKDDQIIELQNQLRKEE